MCHMVELWGKYTLAHYWYPIRDEQTFLHASHENSTQVFSLLILQRELCPEMNHFISQLYDFAIKMNP